MEKTIVVYACGGTGVNIGNMIEQQVALKTGVEDKTKFAKVIVNYIDTSEANIKYKSISSNIYLYNDVDGSGSDRRKNNIEIADSVRDILIKHPPGDLSIVINSTAGGSGSVIGPLIASHLLGQDKLVIAMATQSTSTLKHLANTVDVLTGYESIASRRKKVLPLLLCSNQAESESNVNATICNAVEMLAILFSGNIERLDSADLDHWINFDKVTGLDVGAVLLDIAYDPSVFSKDHVVCSVATLANNPDSKTDFPQLVEYQTVGFINNTSNDDIKNKALHFALIDGPIQQAHDARAKELAEAKRLVSSRKTRKSIANNDADDTGMVY